MGAKALACIYGLLFVLGAAWSEDGTHRIVFAPGIAGIEPLTEGSALVRWDSVDADIAQMRLMVNEHSWGGYEFRGECPADRGWIIVNGLQPRRHYHFELSGTTSKDTCLPGPDFHHFHVRPIVDWAFIPGGEFEMGDSLDPEAAPHSVQLPAYLLSATEITNRDYLDHCSTDSMPLPEDPQFHHLREYLRRYPDFPVLNVTWQDAVAFCNGLSRQMKLPEAYAANRALHSGKGVRLPTEAEWEYAAGRSHGEYPWGSAKPSLGFANFSPDEGDTLPRSRGPVAVKSYPATPSGLYDLAGNVWEWCNDWYTPYPHSQSVADNPAGPPAGAYKVLRGGSWADSSATLRTTNRARLSPTVAMSTVGFRVARSYPLPSPRIFNGTRAEEHNALAK